MANVSKPQATETAFLGKLTFCFGADYFRIGSKPIESISEAIDRLYAGTVAQQMVACFLQNMLGERAWKWDVFPFSQKDLKLWLHADLRIKEEIHFRSGGNRNAYKSFIAILHNSGITHVSVPDPGKNTPAVYHILDPYLRSKCIEASENRIRSAYKICGMNYDEDCPVALRVNRSSNDSPGKLEVAKPSAQPHAVQQVSPIYEERIPPVWFPVAYQEKFGMSYGAFETLPKTHQCAMISYFLFSDKGELPDGFLESSDLDDKYFLYKLDDEERIELFVNFFEKSITSNSSTSAFAGARNDGF